VLLKDAWPSVNDVMSDTSRHDARWVDGSDGASKLTDRDLTAVEVTGTSSGQTKLTIRSG